MTFEVKETDKGYERFMKTLQQMTDYTVKVGVFGDKAAEQYPEGLETNAQIAAKHELGVGVPRRPWLSGPIEDHRAEIEGMLEKVLIATLQGKTTVNEGLKTVGLKTVSLIQERIASSIPPPNSPLTIARKGSTTTLINTGQFRSSITSEVVKGEYNG